MKKAILFVLVLGFVLMGIMADEDTLVKLNYSASDLSTTKIVFGLNVIQNMQGVIDADNDSDLDMKPGTGDDEATIDFYLSWYHYSPDALEVTLEVGAMKNDTSYLPWAITPTLDSTYKGGTANTANVSKITAPSTTDTTITDQIVVTVAANSEGKMTQSYGNVKLSGVATLKDAVPGTYNSSITAAITTN